MAHILLVDDDDAFRSMLHAMLLRLGHRVVEARNGKEAWAMYQAEPAELILLDLIMPEQEGLETILLLREHGVRTKIVAMTGGGRLSTRDMLSAAGHFGADQILAKPFSRAELEEAVNRLLSDPAK